MSLRDQPYFPLYVQDYLTDEKLNLCSASTQGIYIKILCIFHKSENYGGILLKQKDKHCENNKFNFAEKISKLLTFSSDEIELAISELLDEKVLIIEDDFMFQKRMVKDNDISLKRSESGKKGGDNSLGKDKILLKQNVKQITEDEDENEIEVPIKNNKFIKPTIEEITSYCNERNNSVNPNKFYNFYESKGWMVGKNKMKNWKSAVITWEEDVKVDKPNATLPKVNYKIDKETVTHTRKAYEENLMMYGKERVIFIKEVV